MPKSALALLLFFGLPAAAVDSCSALNPIEIAATLRGHGTVIAFRSKGDQDHLHTCFFARVSQVGSFEENVKRIQSENPLILTFVVADGAGSNGSSQLKPDSATADTEVPAIGERAVLRHGGKGEKVAAARIF